MKNRTLIAPFCLMIWLFLFRVADPASARAPAGDTARLTSLETFILEKHGHDAALINGIQYHYPYAQTLSNPYYGAETSLPGSVVLSGTSYSGIRLQYDLYAQRLALELDRDPPGFRKIYVSPLQTEAFELAGTHFVKTTLGEEGPLFYQVIRVQGLSCYIHWKKNRQKTGHDTRNLYKFTGPFRTYFLDLKGSLHPVSGRRELASLFPGEEGKKILKYMRQHRLRLKDIPMDDLKRLMDFMASLSNEEIEP